MTRGRSQKFRTLVQTVLQSAQRFLRGLTEGKARSMITIQEYPGVSSPPGKTATDIIGQKRTGKRLAFMETLTIRNIPDDLYPISLRARNGEITFPRPEPEHLEMMPTPEKTCPPKLYPRDDQRSPADLRLTLNFQIDSGLLQRLVQDLLTFPQESRVDESTFTQSEISFSKTLNFSSGCPITTKRRLTRLVFIAHCSALQVKIPGRH